VSGGRSATITLAEAVRIVGKATIFRRGLAAAARRTDRRAPRPAILDQEFAEKAAKAAAKVAAKQVSAQQTGHS
jgi:hypothetical protein